jgi:peptide chain release factor 3
MDRPAMSPYEIMDQIEQEFGLATYPILWPIGDGERFKGVLDRMNNVVHLFDRGDRKSKAEVEQVSMNDLETLRKSIDDEELYERLLEDQELLVELIPPLDMERVMSGEQSPLFFGSAMTNFGVQLFLDKFCDMGTKPSARVATRKEEVKGNKAVNDDEVEEMISPDHGEFSGFVFKTQANLDPKHRDRLAYIRIVSGTFQKGMKVGHSRSKPGKTFNLAQAQTLFGSDRESVEVAYPGDVIGINNPGDFAIGYVT